MAAEIFRRERTAAALVEPADARIIRLHRVYLARQMAAGLDVLDCSAGDGSGAAVLAQVARSVLALVADQAAREEAEAACPAQNLRFAVAAECAGEAGYDLVLGFEPGAQFSDLDDLLARAAGWLRPGGRLLLGVPDRDHAPPPLLGAGQNGTSVVNHAELLERVGRGFAHAVVLGQRGLIGSAIVGAPGGAPVGLVEHRGRLLVQATQKISGAEQLVCVASNAPIEGLADSLFIDSELDALAEIQDFALQAGSERDALRAEHAALAEQADRQRRTDAEWRHELAVLRVNEAAAVSGHAAGRAKFEAGERLLLTTLAETERRYFAVLDGFQARERATAEELRALRAQRPVGLAQRMRRRLRALRGGGRVAAVRASALFDANWYRERNADVAVAGVDPAVHYVRSGAAEMRDPGPDFDSAWYCAQHPDVHSLLLSPLEHFERHGRAAGWPTRPPVQQIATAPAQKNPNPRVLFVSGEFDTPGNCYRCVRYAAAARDAGWTADWRPLEHTGARELVGVAIVVLWRVRYSEHVAGVMREVRAQGGVVVFDLDDLMIRPELARTNIIDGIRTTNAGITSTRATFAQVQQAMAASDLCTAATEELAAHMREWQKAAYVLPNGFDDAAHTASRLAVRARAIAPSDHFIRIGYAAGTTTHQKDFAVALPGLLHVLKTRPQVRLVLFRAPHGTDMVVVEEFDALAPYADRIEWRASVDLDDLPGELARFDINIAPLEVGNPFCEAKSELKYFEAALVDVATVASPTGPFSRAITHEKTGLMAADDEAWSTSLLRLVDDAEYRRAIGRAAYLDCLWRFGPQRRAELTHAFLEQVSGSKVGAQAFALDMRAAQESRPPPIAFAPAETVFRADRMRQAEVTVVVPCYNYADTVIEALESVRAQTLDPLDLVVVDDASTDPLAAKLIAEWVKRHETRFNRVLILRHTENAGLSAARNTGFQAAETPTILPLDADNRLHPTCCEALLARLRGTDAAFAYPSIKMFGAADSVFSDDRYQPMRFVGGNYIDAMALIAKWAFAAVGGYDMPRGMGWEDFDFYCKLVELGQRGIQVNEVLADYRVHGQSMLAAVVEIDVTKQRMVALMEHRHPWLHLSSRRPTERV